MILKGKRLLLNRPHIEKSAIEMTPELQERIDRENFIKWTRLEVFAVGEDVAGINTGDMVYVSKGSLESCDVIDIEGEIKLMVNEGSICIVW